MSQPQEEQKVSPPAEDVEPEAQKGSPELVPEAADSPRPEQGDQVIERPPLSQKAEEEEEEPKGSVAGKEASPAHHEEDEETEEIPEEQYNRLVEEMQKKRLRDEEENVEGREKFDYSVPRRRPLHKKAASEKKSSVKTGEMSLEPALKDYFVEKIDELSQFNPDNHWNEKVESGIAEFLVRPDRTKMFIWIEGDRLQLSYTARPQLVAKGVEELVYVLKVYAGERVTLQNIESNLFIKGFQLNYLKNVLNLMNTIFIPAFFKETSWPENVKKEFMAQLHKFMATVTEACYQNEGYTELYIPNENISQADGSDKDLIQRLDATILHWQRQIKDVISNQDSQNDAENSGPLDEIMYWRSRKENLKHIDEQLEKPELKEIVEFLSRNESSSVKSFQQVTKNIKSKSEEAADNLKYLQILYNPCRTLETISPKEIPSILGSLLLRVRMIWEYSRNYNNKELITGLLHKISNEIIKRCRSKINVSDMLDGDVEKCIEDLKDAIECGNQWKKIFNDTSELINRKNKENKWDFKNNSIFAQVDAFVQRCSELIEICEGQLQFAMRGSDMQIPKFGGSRAGEIVNILGEIKLSFLKLIDRFRTVSKEKILDVKASNWHELYNTFKNGMKDLDIMYQNIIQFAFEQVSTVEQGVEMLEAFDYLAKRESIKGCLKKKANEILNRFQEQVEMFEYKNISKLMPVFPLSHGHYSGQAIWIRSLAFRIESMKGHIDKMVRFAQYDQTVMDNAVNKYNDVYKTLENYCREHLMNQWKNNEISEFEQEGSLKKRIDSNTLLTRPSDQERRAEDGRAKFGHIECNFDRGLYKLMHEIVAWKTLISFNVRIHNPADSIEEFTEQYRDSLRILREHCMIVVRDYNTIIDFMDPTERSLFEEHLEETNRIIDPGITRLRWSSKSSIDSFLSRTCKNTCLDLYNKLKMFRQNTEKIKQKCEELASYSFLRINKKKVYEVQEFIDEQQQHRLELTRQLARILEEIKNILVETYEPFSNKKKETLRHWFNYVQEIDRRIVDGLKKALKNSLVEFQNVIGEPEKIPATALLKISVDIQKLEKGQDEREVKYGLVYKPPIDLLQVQIKIILNSNKEVVKDFRTMDDQLIELHRQRKDELLQKLEKDTKNLLQQKQQIQRTKEEREDFRFEGTGYENKLNDDDVDKYVKKIIESLKKVCHIVETTNTFDSLKGKFAEPKKNEKYFSNLLKNNQGSQIRTTIAQYESFNEMIQEEKNLDIKECIVIDRTPLKTSLTNINLQTQSSFLMSLQEKCVLELKNLHELFSKSEERLNPVPQNLHQLKGNMDLWKSLIDNLNNYEEQLEPLKENLAELDAHNMPLKEEETKMRLGLMDAWKNFNLMLERIEQRNKKVKADFNSETHKRLEQFIKQSGDSKVHFLANAPFQSTYSNEKAMVILNEYEEVVKNYRSRWEEMKFGFDLFQIKENTPGDLEFVDSEISNLRGIWELKEKWDQKYQQEIKMITFKQVDVDALEESADEFLRTLNRKVTSPAIKKWDIFTHFRSAIDTFKSVLPIIKSLRERYMRERHWVRLQKELSQTIDPESEEFTFDDIFIKKNFLSYSDQVMKICDIAREEYKIEEALEKVTSRWSTIEVQMEPHNKKTWKIKGSDAIFAVLQQHMAVLSSQKTGLYYESFKDKIEEWEVKLQQISETLELLLAVQRQWIYLESIFESQTKQENDRQLIGDINKFKNANERISAHMDRINRDRKIINAILYPNFYTDLDELKKRLDEGQKVLFNLLDRKRKDFPRFYFLSNEDLFELLGNSSDPKKTNKHIKKCFEGIKELKANLLNTSTRKAESLYEVTAMISPDGEEVQFTNRVNCEGGIEMWLRNVEKVMRETLKKHLAESFKRPKDKESKSLEDWVDKREGQLVITTFQLEWTADCTKSISEIEKQERVTKKIWEGVRSGQDNMIKDSTKMMNKNISKLLRSKLVALITIAIHTKDITDQLIKTCTSLTSFEWTKQLRFTRPSDQADNQVNVEQTNTKTPYGWEYQGNNGRLVVTALTDRCYITLTTAMHLKKGGAPQGPAGTGKTETVKDLGKNMAKFVLVFNCSEGLDYKSLGKMFAGLMQTGGWGCFDEFNRIELQVLSVVAQQMLSILNALREMEVKPKPYSFTFEGETILGNDQCSIFITMNPGYAGRSELPDNLKSLFRPISMMVPESTVICEIMLASEGFQNKSVLANKMVALYGLMQQQLSKQDHYDFGLRAIKSVLVCAGAIRRAETSRERELREKEKEKGDTGAPPQAQNNEQLTLMQAILSMNMPKFVQEDIYLFNALLKDLFPNQEIVEKENTQLITAVEAAIKDMSLVIKREQIVKIVQLFDSKNTRHGNMLVGQTNTGKSVCWKVLQRAMNMLNKQNPAENPSVKIETLNPKTISLNELFGFMDPNTMEWNEGVLSSMMARLCKGEEYQNSTDQRWMILDGPVDTLWIESLNTVLDDNKVLTLLNGDRISLPPQVGLIFEVQDLAVASPATVSRAGMVFLNNNDLGWRPFIDSWIMGVKDLQVQEYLTEMVDRWIVRLLAKKKEREVGDVIGLSNDLNRVIFFTKLLEAFVKSEAKSLSFDLPNKSEIYWNLLEKWFMFCLVWSLGMGLDENGRKIFDSQVRDIEGMLPHSNTVYDYYISIDKNEWLSWEEKVNMSIWKPPAGAPFHKMLVPTIDSAKNRYILLNCITHRINTLSVGVTGTGKTVLVNEVISQLDESAFSSMNVIFSSQTSSLYFQEMIEGRLKKRAKNKLVPDGQKLVIFVDDLNMPKKDKFGAQPPLELLRQWMDYEGWFDRNNREMFMYVLDIQFISAMGPPGGGRAQISPRVQSKFYQINFNFPSESQVRRIFQSILAFKFQDFQEEIRPLAEQLSEASFNLYCKVTEAFLPTPAKSHYVFNMRDISKVVQGIFVFDRLYCDSKLTILRLWVHECMRVFCDRLVSFDDRNRLKKIVAEQLELSLQSNIKDCTNENEEDTIFVDFVQESVSERVIYVEVPYKDREQLKKLCENYLAAFNKANSKLYMNIVLFGEAVSYICKIHRIMKLGKGHGMLIGEGGAGRHSLTRLATYVCKNYFMWTVQVTKNFKSREFREAIKDWTLAVGFNDKSGVFMFSDNQISQESFIEDINTILTIGEIPNLYSKDELSTIKDKTRKYYTELEREKNPSLDKKDVRVTNDKLMEFFHTNVQNSFHIILLMSKTGDNLRNYCRMYPGLVNNTTQIWFMPWPQEALTEVADRYLETMGIPEIQQSIAHIFSQVHLKVIALASRMLKDLKRLYYVTPTNFVQLVKGYKELLSSKQLEMRNEIGKLQLGLVKLDEAQTNSNQLKKTLDVLQGELSRKSKDCDQLFIKIERETREMNDRKNEVYEREQMVNKEKKNAEDLSKEAMEDLQKAEPALVKAENDLNNLTKEKLVQIRSFSSPPAGVDTVLNAVMILLGKEPNWASAKKEMNDQGFMQKLKLFDKQNVSTKTLLKLEKLTKDPKMDPSYVERLSDAAAGLCRWVRAIEDYAKAFKDIEPKRIKVKNLQEKIAKSEEELTHLKNSFIKLQGDLNQLNIQFEKAKSDKLRFEEEAKQLQIKLERAEKLITLLGSTKIGWEERKKRLEEKSIYITGDSLVSSAFLSYAGPFPSEYRDDLINGHLVPSVKAAKIPFSKDFSFPEFLIRPVDFIKWHLKGLPDDQFSRENGVLTRKGWMYPLLIDPQLQGNKWLRELEREGRDPKMLQILTPQSQNYLYKIELAIANGRVVILQNVEEEIDVQIEHILNRRTEKAGDKIKIHLGEKEILYNQNFRLYMTSKLPNPKYKAEILTKVTLVNFMVKEKGLEEQLNSVVIQRMEQNLENNKKEQIMKKSENEEALKQLDEDILRILSNTKGSLIEDESLIITLQKSKEMEEKVKHQIEASVTQMKKIVAARQNYRKLANVASKMFFIINDFNLIDPMYQFSLDSYIQLFVKIIKEYIEKPGLNDALDQKLEAIAERHKGAVYRYACRSLFEKDKLLLGLMMTVKLTDVDEQQYNFFLRGSDVVDRKGQPINPNDWISENSWNTICDLDKTMPNFSGIVGAFTHNAKEWKRWYMSSNPEKEPLPGEWNEKCDPLKKMIIIKAIRRDRVIPAVANFIQQKQQGGTDLFVNPPFSMDSAYADSNKITPIIFILSPGVDPYNQLQSFAKQKGPELVPVSLGQGQDKRAKERIHEGVKNDSWLYLANCHLSLNFLREFEKVLQNLEQESKDDSKEKNFRIWLSTNPHPKFPISVLQRCVKVTTEPPKGLRANMLRLYGNMERDKFDGVKHKPQYKKLLFSLCWLHSIVIERKRFKTLGWNVIYDFNDSDWETSDKILINVLNNLVKPSDSKSKAAATLGGAAEPTVETIQPNWDAIKYLVSEVTYGGRVTDEWDRRLLNVYAEQYLNQKVISEEKHKLGDPALSDYVIPEQFSSKEKPQDKDESKYYYKKIEEFPITERPQAFGQHINAEISSQIADTNTLIDSITFLQPRSSKGREESSENWVKEIIKETMMKVDEEFNLEEVLQRNRISVGEELPNPLKVVLVQEISRYNRLLAVVKKSLINLELGISGQVLISEELEVVMRSISDFRVPDIWKFAYYSLKPLNSWIDDLHKRIEQLRNWAYKGQPNVFWISGFSFPTGFTTALQQQAARKSYVGVAVNEIIWEFSFQKYDTTITQPAPVGAYVDGLYLEGARWDGDKNCIIDAEPMKLYCKMPVIQFKPAHDGRVRQKKGQNIYKCPTYMYPVRTGTDRPSFMFSVNLPCKPNPNSTEPEEDFWVKRGTALLMSLAD